MSILSKDEPVWLNDVQMVLNENAYTRRTVRVGVEDGIVVLTGKVSTYYAKQTAQEIVRPILKSIGHKTLRNNILVITRDF